MLPDAATFPVNANVLEFDRPVLVLSFVVFALISTLSPTLGSVTVVVPTMKSDHVEPSVEYSRDKVGPLLLTIDTVEFASSAVNLSLGSYSS